MVTCSLSSSKGVSKLESDVQYFIDVVKTYPVSSEVVLSTADMLTLRYFSFKCVQCTMYILVLLYCIH